MVTNGICKSQFQTLASKVTLIATLVAPVARQQAPHVTPQERPDAALNVVPREKDESQISSRSPSFISVVYSYFLCLHFITIHGLFCEKWSFKTRYFVYMCDQILIVMNKYVPVNEEFLVCILESLICQQIAGKGQNLKSYLIKWCLLMKTNKN